MNATLPLYEIHGLRIRSEIGLPGARAVQAAGHDVEVFCGQSRPIPAVPAEGSVLAEVTFGEGRGYSVTQTAGGFTIRFFNTCDFDVTHDRRIVRVHPGSDHDPRLTSLLFEGNVLATLLMLAGEPVLHASAIAVDGSAVAFVGDSGSGKSTLAALLCAAGGRLISDDVLRVAPAGLHCYRGARQIRLRSGAASLADQFPAPSIEITVDGRTAISIDGPESLLPPLAAIVLPRPSRSIEQLYVHELVRGDALFALMRHPRILGWKSFDVIRMQFDALARVVARIPLFVADIPWGPPFEAELPAKLLRDIGVEHLVADHFR